LSFPNRLSSRSERNGAVQPKLAETGDTGKQLHSGFPRQVNMIKNE